MTTQTNGNNLLLQGRLIWGLGASLFSGKPKTDMQSNLPVVGKDGVQAVEYGFGLAIPKIDPATGQPTAEYQKVWKALHDEAFTLYPGGQLPPNFAMKYKDGDGVDHNGKSFADREGYAGHIVISCTTRIPIKYFVHQGGNNVLVNDGIKIGDYVNVQLNLKAHPAQGQGKAGLYVNPSAVQLIQPGKEIINTPSGDQLFGQNAPAYAGQVIMDTAPAMPGQPLPATAIPGQLAPTQAIPGQPHYDVLPATHQPITHAMPGQPLPGQALPATHAMPGQPLPGQALPATHAMPGMP